MTAALPPTLQRVLKGKSCAGCGLCAGLDPAIGMTRDAKGWKRPVALGTPAPGTDALLAKVCPGATISPWTLSDAPETHPFWGPHVRVLTGNSTDAEIRHTASSGGALSSLALHLLRTGAVNRVLHVGMNPEKPLETLITRSADRDDILATAGSRYAPVSPLETLRTELEAPGNILFIGKPCDVGAMRQLMQADPAVAARIPYLLSFFCAGTPSQDGTDRIVRKLGFEPEEVAHFRYRGDGWPGFATAETADGRRARISYAASWGDILSKEVQFRCKICPDGVGGAADVAAADAWYGGETGYPEFEEADGRSLILTRTRKGDALVAAAEAAGALSTEPLAIGEIRLMQPSQANRRRLLASRLAAMAVTLMPRPNMQGLHLGEARRQARAREEAKSFVGTVRRIVTGRI
ncbi:Coenzyme F420 hydrogenase/dehydrogenase, beta subunit C-terminal domain [Sandaracinobacter sp. RS1-74]|uniref:Coenzyme F420 hydrogenase/dehydrogenase, beta subunit C-terminal domain n=1 Tax=Sandaracinobacteroides sayramensis TaxID=2913411 RepID=UPI001EDC6637|nr:Coenzyme F420 hydrogenase/dehydrogenase, beta subunit C-terminal domain [Sandaracinobacteroides sayramensis]MCG2840242.1 Coenzyme F420 hydrogenase/dehydrogenase, beta subunit C-terminal domain [Sandaracinobacteroides sayramensis]